MNTVPPAWRLDGAHVTLLLLPRDASPEIAYWGPRLPDGLDVSVLPSLRSRAVARNALDQDHTDALLLPTLGAGPMRQPAFAASRDDGCDWTAEFRLDAVEQGDGALVLRLEDPVARLGCVLRLRLAPDDDVLVQDCTIVNRGDAPLRVEQLGAGGVLWPQGATELLGFDGYWGHEFTERRMALDAGRFTVDTRRGRGSHEHVPALIGGQPGFDEESGLVHGVQLGWSGNHQIAVERLEDGRALVLAGLLLHPGEQILQPGEALDAPTVYATLSETGLNGLSQRFHRHVRRHVLPFSAATAPRPVTLNTWEGNYFDHDQGTLMAQADAAAALGIERFVLDDGWMRGRHHERAGLGDWVPDPAKYPDGIGPLAEHVVSRGMQFGLWVEPECVNPDSDLHRAHPDAVLHVEGRPLRTARRQLVVDITRPEIAARIENQIDALLRAHPIGYLKWDMNRDLVAAAGRDGRPAYHRHVLALHAMIDRLRAAHPALEIESCASGGGRPDLGMLARTHRVWTSDCTDALDRIAIQRGFSRLYPPEVMGAHVSASPNHQTGRVHTLGFRAAVALFGHFGVELDPLRMTDAERTELSAWIALHKQLRPLLHGGAHVAVPKRAGREARGVVAFDRRSAAWCVMQTTSADRRIPAPLLLPGLDPVLRYRIRAPLPQAVPARSTDAHRQLFGDGLVAAGALLERVGLVLPEMQAETALVLTLDAEN